MAFRIRFRGTEHVNAVLSTIGYGHVWNWSTVRVKNSAFDSLSKLGLFNQEVAHVDFGPGTVVEKPQAGHFKSARLVGTSSE
jgi:hypothetical protein